jgi:mono/diheme cytochrome c family protein
MRCAHWTAATLCLSLFTACGPSAEELEAARAEALRLARADSTAQAIALFNAATFDTIAWIAPDSALVRGQTVYRFSCQRCHGFIGRGDGDLATEHGIEMPDLTVASWPYEGDLPALRERIFVGHESEMPNWGLHGLAYRDVDAVAHHILEVIRADR